MKFDNEYVTSLLEELERVGNRIIEHCRIITKKLDEKAQKREEEK